MKCDKKLKLDLAENPEQRSKINWLEKQARIKTKDALADKKTGTEITSLLWKKEIYFTGDMNGWFDLDERFNAVSAYCSFFPTPNEEIRDRYFLPFFNLWKNRTVLSSTLVLLCFCCWRVSWDARYITSLSEWIINSFLWNALCCLRKKGVIDVFCTLLDTWEHERKKVRFVNPFPSLRYFESHICKCTFHTIL